MRYPGLVRSPGVMKSHGPNGIPWFDKSIDLVRSLGLMRFPGLRRFPDR